MAGDGDIYAYFGLTNSSDLGGSGQINLEYNQQDNIAGNGGSVPHRTPGDLLFQFEGSGSNALVFKTAWQYTPAGDFGTKTCFTITGASPAAGWCQIAIPAHTLASSLDVDGTFAEGAINMTTLFDAGGTCSGSFGQVNMRSVTGSSVQNASLKDHVAPLGVSTPSTCATLKIEKRAAGTGDPLGGATFEVTPDPASPDGTGSLTVEDNDSNDLDPADGVIEIGQVEPDSYTVTETSPPSGYLLPASGDRSHTLSVAKSATATFTFTDPKAWQALTVSKTAQGSYDAHYTWSIDKGVADTTDGPFEDTARQEIPQGWDNTADFAYQVEVSEGERTTGNYQVTGEVSVTNPNDAAVDVTLTDGLSDSTECTFDDDSVTVPADSTTPYSYTCDYGSGQPVDADEITNAVEVSWDKSTYPQAQADVGATGDYSATASADVSWTESPHDKTVRVTDDRHDFGTPGWQITWGDEDDGVYARTYTVPLEGDPGECTSRDNTATVLGERDAVLGSDTATATLCLLVPDISIEKQAWDHGYADQMGHLISSGSDVVSVTTVTWTYTVTNTGETTLNDITVTDDQLGDSSGSSPAIDCPETSLAVDESMICTASGEVTAQ